MSPQEAGEEPSVEKVSDRAGSAQGAQATGSPASAERHFLVLRVEHLDVEADINACIAAWFDGDEGSKRRTDVARVQERNVAFESRSLQFPISSGAEAVKKTLVIKLLDVVEEADGEGRAFKANEAAAASLDVSQSSEDELSGPGLKRDIQLRGSEQGDGVIATLSAVVSLVTRAASRPSQSRPSQSRPSSGRSGSLRPPSGKGATKGVRRSSDETVITTDSFVRRRTGAPDTPGLLLDPAELGRMSPVRARSADSKHIEDDQRLPSLVSKPRQAFGTPDSTERSYWASEKEEANGEMAGKEIWEVEDAVDDPGVGKPGRPISAGVRTAEVKKLQAESKKVRELVQALRHDVEVRNKALEKCGVEIRELREQNKELARDRHSLKKRLMEVEVQTRELMDLENLEELPRHELERRITLLTQRYRAEKRRSGELNGLRKKLQERVVQLQQYYEKYHELQRAHLKQAEFIQSLQDEMRKIDRYRKTARNQEKVIEKLEDLLEASVEDTKKARKVLQEHDKMVAHIQALEEELKELKEHVVPSKDEQLEQLRNELQNRGTASSDEVEQLKKENEELKKQLEAGGGKKKQKPENWQKEKLMLMMQRDKAEARNRSLEKQMMENQSSMSKEAAELRLRVKQLEDELAKKR